MPNWSAEELAAVAQVLDERQDNARAP